MEKEELILQLKSDIAAFGEDYVVYPYFKHDNENQLIDYDLVRPENNPSSDYETLGNLLIITE